MLKTIFLVLVCSLSFFSSSKGMATSLNFENLIDSTLVGDNYSADGIHFVNTIALVAGISLNDIDFPPSSGLVAITDNGAPIRISFDFAVTDIFANFTYSLPLTLNIYSDNAFNNLLGSLSSTSSSNLGVTELINMGFSGVRSLEISGDPSGFSFIMDDLNFQSTTPVPEPAEILLFVSGLVGMLLSFRKKLNYTRALT